MLVVFDFDNTLEEFAPHERAVEDALLGELAARYLVEPGKLREVWDDLKRAYVNVRATPHDYDRATWFGELFRIFHMPEPVQVWVRRYWEALDASVRVFPGTFDALARLRRRHTVCILSDSDGDRATKLRRVEQLGLRSYIDEVFTGDSVGHTKPHPRVFLQVLEHYGVAAEHAVMVGDNPPGDLRVPKELGLHTVWLLQGVEPAARSGQYDYVDVECLTIEDVPDAVERLVVPVSGHIYTGI